jgi:UDP-glucose 4-epimerase
MQQLKVVITGASGFLGGCVQRKLAAQKNVEVIAVTRRDIHGWCSVPDYSQSPIGDVLIHLAEDNDRARVAVAAQAYEEKVQATLAALLEKGYRRVVYASSAVLYGDADMQAHFPDDPVRIDDAYTHVKRLSELAVLKLPSGIVVRLANIYGPGMSKNNVMSAILRQLSGEGVLEVMDTSPVRDFIWVEDAAEGIVALALNLAENGSERGLYNLGTGVGTSIGALASMALKLARKPDRPVKSIQLPDRPSSLILDFSDTTTACGWRPTTTLLQGLTQLLHIRKERT